MWIDLTSHLEGLEKSLGNQSTLYKQTLQASRDHPNLRAYLDHFKVVRLCTPDVNQFVDSIDITHRSDEGGSLEIMPFITDKGIRIYSDPPIFVAGYRNPNGFGEKSLADWEEFFKDAEISPEVCRKVKYYLSAHAPVSYDECGGKD